MLRHRAYLTISSLPDTKLICWAALLNNQPLGFYTTDVFTNDAKRRLIRILPVDVNQSEARCTVESKGAVRLSLTCVKGLSSSKAQRVEAARRTGKSVSIKDFVRRTQLDCSVIERLVAAGAYDVFNLPPREICSGRLDTRSLARTQSRHRTGTCVSRPPRVKRLGRTRLGIRCTKLFTSHPSHGTFARKPQELCTEKRCVEIIEGRAWVASLAICIQRPPTAKGVAFLVLEDECGLMNVVIMPQVYERYRSVFRLSCFVLCTRFCATPRRNNSPESDIF